VTGDISILGLPKNLTELHAYWNSKRRGAAIPRRGDIDPIDLKPWLGSLLMLTVLGEGDDFRYDVFGVNLVEILGYDLTRRTVRECGDLLLPQVLEEYKRLYATGQPVFVRRESPYARDHQRLEKLILPLADDQGRIAKILVALHRAAA
jgi:hypothetical protein